MSGEYAASDKTIAEMIAKLNDHLNGVFQDQDRKCEYSDIGTMMVIFHDVVRSVMPSPHLREEVTK